MSNFCSCIDTSFTAWITSLSILFSIFFLLPWRLTILSLISADMVFNRLSKVRLLGRYDNNSPQAFITLLLFENPNRENDAAVICLNPVWLNHIRTIKHRRRTAGEYTLGLPLKRCFLTELHDDQSINPTKYRMLNRMNDELIIDGLREGIWFNHNMIL